MNPAARSGLPYDPTTGRIPASLEDRLNRDAPSVLLLVPAGAARRSGWTADAAIGFATGLAGTGRDVVLVDLSLEEPELHVRLEAHNLEGVVDVFHFGASLDRVTQGVPGRPFRFVAAGTYVPDAQAVLGHARWDRIFADFESSGATLLLYVPPSVPGFDVLAERAGRALILGNGEDIDRVRDGLPPECDVLGTMVPSDVDAVAPAPPSAAPAEEIDAADLEMLGPAATRGKRGSLLGSVVRVLLVAAVALAAYFAFERYLERAYPAEAAPVTQPAGTPAADRAGAGQDAGATAEPVPVSVAIEAHPELPVAQERVQALRSAEPDIEFFLAPVQVNGVTYYQLLSGPLADVESGEALMRRLVDAGHKTAMESWAVRQTPWAFDLGTYPSRAEADRRRSELDARGVPAYIVVVPRPDGPPVYRVYGGAYENPAAAEIMERTLESAGVSAELVRRMGRSTG